MKKIDHFQDFDFVLYQQPDEKLTREYEKMFSAIKAAGHAVASDAWPLDGGILLERGEHVIAGAFFNTSKSKSSLLIHIVYVEHEYRKQGIYKKLHTLLDDFAKSQGRSHIYSYIHVDNKTMTDVIMDKIGYEPVMTLVKRKVND